MVNLETSYLGFRLKCPLVASSSPFCEHVGHLKMMEDAGIAAVVLHSLFEEQLSVHSRELDRDLFRGSEAFAEAVTYLPEHVEYSLGPEAYLEHVRKAKDALQIPVIASLNGSSKGGWLKYAKLIEEAGADALELNIYYLPTDPEVSGVDVEREYLELVKMLVDSVQIPIAVKISHFFSSIPYIARQLDECGIGGLVIFNRFYQPDFDLQNLEVVPNLSLSHPYELKLRLRWAAILSDQVKADIAITGGVHSAEEVLKSMMAGAKVAMTTSALLANGIGHARKIIDDTRQWMEQREYSSIEQMQGSMSHSKVENPKAFGRANYLKVLRRYSSEYLRENPFRA